MRRVKGGRRHLLHLLGKDKLMGSGSSTTQLLDARNSSTSEGRRDKSKTEKKSSDRQGQLDAILLANKHKSILNKYGLYH